MKIVPSYRTFILYKTHILSIVETGADHEVYQRSIIPRIIQMDFYTASPVGLFLYKGQGVVIALEVLEGFLRRTRTRPRQAATRAVNFSMLGMK